MSAQYFYRFLGITLLLFGCLTGGAWAADLQLSVDESLSQTGYFQLSWKGGEGQQPSYTLQQRTEGAYTTIYEGTDTGRALSGLGDGQYQFRIRAGQGEWSTPLKVEVQHYSQSTTLLFLGIGALVTLATAILVFVGHTSAYRNQEASA